MNRIAPSLVAVAGAALVAAAPAMAAPMPAMPAPSGATATEVPRSSVDVIGSRLYVDTQGAGKGTLLARTKVRYRHTNTIPKKP